MGVTQPVLDVTLEPVQSVAPAPVALAPTLISDDLVLMFERLAKDPAVDVQKLQQLIEMRKEIMRLDAEAAYNAAFAEMQPFIPVITERKDGDNGKWSFAPLEDIVEPLRPILSRFGFSVAHKTVWPDAKTVKVIGILKHRAGHSETSEFQAGADQTGSKNAIQALGSTVAYGKRYTVKDLLCIVTRGEDDDGSTSEQHKAPAEPDGYAMFVRQLEAAAVGGNKSLFAVWNKADAKLRSYMTKYQASKWAAVKAVAEKVGA